MKWFLLVFSCLMSVSLPSFVLAQLVSPASANFGLTVSPQYPAPGEPVTITVDDYSLGSSNSKIVWKIDNIINDQVTNNRSITATAGKVDIPTTITAELTLGDGRSLSTTVTITPKYLDIIIEPQTYTPQFYQGRALPVHDSQVRAIAILHSPTGPVDASTYSYTWKVNNTVLDGGSQRGNANMLYTVPQGKTHVISVEVMDSTGRVVAKKNTAVQSHDVEAVLYEVNALYGLSHKAVSAKLPFIGNSMTLRAVPYNLDNRAVTGNALFSEWKINNVRTKANSADPFEISVSRTGFGVATIGYSVRNINALLQGDSTSVQLQF
jgi:hypothetical protein